MPSWLSEVVELSILQRFRSFNDLAAQMLSEWGHVDARTDRAIENEMQRHMEDPDDPLDEESALNVAGYAGDEYYDDAAALAAKALTFNYLVFVFPAKIVWRRRPATCQLRPKSPRSSGQIETLYELD